MRKERLNVTRSGDALEPWEHRDIRREHAQDALYAKFKAGHLSFGKYSGGLETLRRCGYIHDADYESDIEYDEEDENDSEDEVELQLGPRRVRRRTGSN